jgi:hypothetical protein
MAQAAAGKWWQSETQTPFGGQVIGLGLGRIAVEPIRPLWEQML